ncbi:putative MFS family arabinose efflux permease [Streptomyces umbrinus]|uniref:MFS transporter n=1 Tax=Streptomyces umbrinus TaxID=67370 RepID=UPI00167CDF4A|nr:MFS transporter [Streptomyces umbrinus]MCR3728000.1 putative MFS family arabinose efflux permease [Streptomyces umbrinus]GHH53875.1 MFS transporter [Streptomyces umbrinus]
MSTTSIPLATVSDGPAHRDPNVLRWLGAYTASMVGDNVYYLALTWAAVQAGTPAQAGIVAAVSAVPRALLMLGGGVLADRFGPRKVVIGSDAVRCAAVLAVAALLFATTPGLWPLALLALVFGTVDAVFMPAVGALPARITGRGQLTRVQGMRGLAIRFANVVGAPLGGLGIALGGPAAAFGLAGLLIAVSVPLLVSLRVADLPGDDRAATERPTAWSDLRDGLRYIRGHRVLAPLIVAIALGDLGFVGPLNVGLTLLADERGWGASGVGWVLAGFGVGAGTAALLIAVRGGLPYAGRVMAVTILAGSVAVGALAYVPNVVAAAGVAVLVGLLTGLSGALCGALLQTRTDPAYLGRVSSVSGIVSLGLAPLSMPVSAAAIGAWGTGPVFVVSAAVCGLGGVLALCVRDLRRAELPK